MAVAHTAAVVGGLRRYAERFHAVVGDRHHVASPLGAWLVLALAAPASRDGERLRLEEVLGMPAGDAAALASALLSRPHPLVAAAVAVWDSPAVATPALVEWLAGLPEAVERGAIPSQDEADRWASERTHRLIERFPLDLGPTCVLLLASALATRVSWEVPFDVVPASRLGLGSRWAGRLRHVLAAPADPRHRQYIARTPEAGDVAVHIARARGGLQVVSVVAAAEVASRDVLAAAHRLAVAAAGTPLPDRQSLFDLPLGEGRVWTISEQAASTTAPDGREERCSALLPAWSARSDHDLRHEEALGFPAAAAALIRLLPPPPEGYRWDARQSAMAHYSRVGFEAAAVTALGVFVSAPMRRDGLVRTAELRFGHPFAVVACTVEDRAAGPADAPETWHGLPVFSAWITEPEDAGPGVEGRGG